VNDFLKRIFKIAEAKRTPELIGADAPDDVNTFGFVDGLLDPKVRAVCAQDVVDGTLEWCCWKCGGFDGLFSPETAVDIPKNSQGAWVRLHKKCA
jgi:hypothetical protein